MIRHLSYVACDLCGNPAPEGDTATEARNLARSGRFTFMKVDTVPAGLPRYMARRVLDLCPECRPDRPQHCGQPCEFHAGVMSYFCAVCKQERFIG